MWLVLGFPKRHTYIKKPTKADNNYKVTYVSQTDYSLQTRNWRELKFFKIKTDMKLKEIKHSGRKKRTVLEKILISSIREIF